MILAASLLRSARRWKGGGQGESFPKNFPPLGDSTLLHPRCKSLQLFGFGAAGHAQTYFLLEVDSRLEFYMGLFFKDPSSWEKEVFSPPTPSPPFDGPHFTDERQKTVALDP